MKAEDSRLQVDEIRGKVMAFIGGKTNRKISDKDPAQYIPKIIENIGKEPLVAQSIPIEPALLQKAKYKDFLAERRRMICSILNSFLGT